jgi:hypothetical protein
MGEQALQLILADNDRSWKHLLDSGATITWEAWDLKYKSNLDWNHAWGAAPANILPRFILGAQPSSPGWVTARIRPNISGLHFAEGRVPTPHGSILIDWRISENPPAFRLNLTLPAGIEARLELPVLSADGVVMINEQRVKATRSGRFWIVDAPLAGILAVSVN